MKFRRPRQTLQVSTAKRRNAAGVIVIALTIIEVVLNPPRGWCEQAYQFYALKRPHPQPAYDFSLQDQNGKSFSLGSVRGKLVLMTFGFTHCANICPAILANLAAAYKLLSAEEQARVQVLFVSIDPSRDTSKTLKDYVPFFDQHFVGLTGKPDQIATATKAYAVEYDQKPQSPSAPANSDNIEHTAEVYLVAPSGEWIGFYGNRQLQNHERIAEDLRHFLALSPEGWRNWEPEKRKVVKAPPASGRELYLQQCASCHLENGRGVPGKYPSLVGSDWVVGAPNRLTTLVVNGVKGTATANGAYSGVMPAWRTILTPADTAAVLTYIRQAWGNSAPAISARYVQDLSYQFGERDFWSWKELKALPADANVSASGL
jgi:protein SCO1/2